MFENNEQCSCSDECTDAFFSMMKDQVQSMYSSNHQVKRLASEDEKRRIKQWFRDALSDMRGWDWETKAKIVKGKVNACYEHSHIVVGVLGKDIDYYLDAAGILFWWGQYTWKRGGRREGIRAMLRAAHCLGAWQGARHQLEKEENRGDLSKIRSEAGKKGAKARSSPFELVKNEFLSLIEELMPDGGWKNRTSAIKGVHSELSLYIVEHDVDLDPDNLVRLISDWCRDKKSPEFNEKVKQFLKSSGPDK
ncbi:hypothetical protein ACJ6TS_20990 [Citrobacter telavivensis]